MLGKNRDCNTELYPIVQNLHMAAWWEWYFPNSMCFKRVADKESDFKKATETALANTHLDILAFAAVL